ncbi:MAG: hypothetical protein IIA48_07395 [Bacteroidetes bacterium]|nr:hypothetical protein [Bacteroidota bacterium]
MKVIIIYIGFSHINLNGAEAPSCFFISIPRPEGRGNKARGNNLNLKILFSFYGYKARGNYPNL